MLQERDCTKSSGIRTVDDWSVVFTLTKLPSVGNAWMSFRRESLVGSLSLVVVAPVDVTGVISPTISSLTDHSFLASLSSWASLVGTVSAQSE